MNPTVFNVEEKRSVGRINQVDALGRRGLEQQRERRHGTPNQNTARHQLKREATMARGKRTCRKQQGASHVVCPAAKDLKSEQSPDLRMHEIRAMAFRSSGGVLRGPNSHYQVDLANCLPPSPNVPRLSPMARLKSKCAVNQRPRIPFLDKPRDGFRAPRLKFSTLRRHRFYMGGRVFFCAS